MRWRRWPRRPPLRAGCPVLLTLGWRGATHYARCARFVRTGAARMRWGARCARSSPRLRCSAPQTSPPPHPACRSGRHGCSSGGTPGIFLACPSPACIRAGRSAERGVPGSRPPSRQRRGPGAFCACVCAAEKRRVAGRRAQRASYIILAAPVRAQRATRAQRVAPRGQRPEHRRAPLRSRGKHPHAQKAPGLRLCALGPTRSERFMRRGSRAARWSN